MLRDFFGFAERQEKSTYSLSYILTLNKDDTTLVKAAGVAHASNKSDHILWCGTPLNTIIQHQGFLSEKISSKTPTELGYIERSAFMKEVNNQNLWNFESGSQKSMNVTIWIIIVFQERALQDLQILIIDSFCRIHGASAQCLIGTENYLDAGILTNYDDDYYSQRYRQIKEAFRAL